MARGYSMDVQGNIILLTLRINSHGNSITVTIAPHCLRILTKKIKVNNSTLTVLIYKVRIIEIENKLYIREKLWQNTLEGDSTS